MVTIKRGPWIITVVIFAVFAVLACDVTIWLRPICRGDSTPALLDTSLVRCSTLDSLARDTTR